ncbi:MAG: fibronectin type III domain-containing protein [Nitrospirae bacterium]|nr:fibronectin type III domain-containing protein [Nitrospirota bacterium]
MTIWKNILLVFPSYMLLIILAACGGGGGEGISSGSVSNENPVPAVDDDYTNNSDSPPLPNGSLTLTWDAPTTNSDGTPLSDLAGYKIYFGTSSYNYSSAIDAGNVTAYNIENLPSGTYYFVIVAYDTSGNESTFSNEISTAFN